MQLDPKIYYEFLSSISSR